MNGLSNFLVSGSVRGEGAGVTNQIPAAFGSETPVYHVVRLVAGRYGVRPRLAKALL